MPPRLWLGAEQVPSHYLIRCGFDSMSCICITWPQWVNFLVPGNTIWHHGTSSALVWTMIHWSLCWCHMASLSWSTLVKVMAKPSPDSLLSIHYKRSVAFTQWQQFLRKYSWYQSLKCVEDHTFHRGHYINGLVQDCSISKALTMEILQFCTKPLLSY